MYFLPVYLYMRAILFILLLAITASSGSLAEELILSGVYQGKDVYVQNPYSPADKSFCTDHVYVNDKEIISNPNTSGFIIKLSHLKINEKVVIRIIHKPGCIPRIVNPDVIKPVSDFTFISAQANRNAISWHSSGELPGGKFIIERKLPESDWKELIMVPGKGSILSGNYELPVDHKGGENVYRIRFEGPDEKIVYSNVFSFNYKEEPITFFPYKATGRITLSRTAEYLITDKDGIKYLEGKNDIINVVNLPEGEYILHIQNREEPFIKEKVKRPPQKKRKKKDND